MQCNVKAMVKVGLGLGIMATAAYVFIPGVRPAVIAVAPFLFFLLCPISMIFMARSMSTSSCRTRQETDAQTVKTPTAFKETDVPN